MGGLFREKFPNGDRGTGELCRKFAVRIVVLLVGLQTFLVGVRGQQAGSAESTASSDAAPAPSRPENSPKKKKIGPLEVSGSWRVRTEGWNWFQGSTGENDYALGHSLFRIGIGQDGDEFEWKFEAAQDAIFGLPTMAVVAAPQGQLGLGGTYFASNGNGQNNANGFVKQAYFRLKKLGPLSVQAGRFEFFDGMEVKPKDPTLSTVVETRISQRLIGNFGWSAVQRSFDGAYLSADTGNGGFSLLAVRPTRGVYQIDGMGELNVSLFYGSYIHSIKTKFGAGRFRVFGVGYIDNRDAVLKTDNRPAAVRGADHNDIQIGTYGADYVQIVDLHDAGKLDVVLWGVLQNGSWGVQTQRASAYFTELGWQPKVQILKPWFSVGYSSGSGDGNPNDSTHGTFFQILPTPRPYARFPFFDMMNNDDFMGSLNLVPVAKLKLRSELHSLRLANAHDLWYLGGGAFQTQTFGYTGRPSNGDQSLANMWDISADYQLTKSFSTTLYYGHAWGKSVIRSIYPANPDGQFAYLESNLRF
jgi:hypothetical protein